MSEWISVRGIIVKGHQVASGQGNDPQFPGGTLRMQRPAFSQRGLDLSPYFPGTINLSIRPHTYAVKRSRHTFRTVKWADHRPAEDFSFFDCQIDLANESIINGLVYYPHPETKPMHFQDPSILEILMPFIEGLHYGDSLQLDLRTDQIEILPLDVE